jgi:uncharacterized membrane protein
MSTRWKLLVAILVVAIAVTCVYVAANAFLQLLTRSHQQSTTKELASWASEYSVLEDDNDARRAVDMLTYIQNYYVVADGYRSDPETEQQLESQRAETLQAISAALDEYIEANPDARAESLKAAKAKALGEQ